MPYKLAETKELVLPGDEPKTAIVIRPLNHEEWSIIEAAAERERNALRRIGRDVDDSDAIRKQVVMEQDAIAGAVVEIRHPDDTGVLMTDREKIAVYLHDLPVQLYRAVRAVAIQTTALSELEGKA